jgi:polar amino acid transport system substrate-binding protein
VHRSTFLLALLTASIAACGLPRDADGTLARARHGVLRVGVVRAEPWVSDSNGAVAGVEGALVARIAQALDARVEWVRRSESELLEGLHARKLDLVDAGLTKESPWAKEVALTRPYYVDTLVVAAARGASVGSLDGLQVAVEVGDPIADELRGRGAVPVAVPDIARATLPVAVPSWRAAALGLVPTGVVLGEHPHVLAVAPGENAWLVYVERTLRREAHTIARALRSVRP